jgi:hypothetical protein
MTEYVRDTGGNVIRQIHPDGSMRQYEYDAKNNCMFERDESGITVAENQSPSKSENKYNAFDNKRERIK